MRPQMEARRGAAGHIELVIGAIFAAQEVQLPKDIQTYVHYQVHSPFKAAAATAIAVRALLACL